MAEVAAAVAIGASLLGAYGSYQSGKIQQKMYNIRGQQARIASDQQSLNEKRKGLGVLKKIMSHNATINARSAAGAIDAFSGTPNILKVLGAEAGLQDYGMTRDNSALIETMGILREIDSRQAGSFAAYQGRLNAIMQVGQATATYAMIGGGNGGNGATGVNTPGYLEPTP